MATDVRDALVKGAFPLPDGWEWRWQDEVFSFQGGAQPPAATFVDSPRPGYTRLVQIRDYYTDAHATFVPDSAKLRKCSPRDVMIARYGSSSDSGSENSLGRICRGIEGAYNVALAKAIPKPGIDPGFLFYLLQSNHFQLPLRAAGARSVQAGFNRESLSTIALPVPPLPEQLRIAHILGTLDEKIELNRRMNETLEAVARALFKSWFVNFDPVRAKAEGSDPGLPPHLADLFPSRFVESSLGPMPEGWTAGILASISELNPESWTTRTIPEEIEYVDLSSTKWGEIAERTGYSREDAPSRARRVLRAGDTIVGTVRPGNGSYAYIASDGLTGSTGFAVLRPRSGYDQTLCYLAATQADVIDSLARIADGGAYPAIRPEAVANQSLVLAPVNLRTAFHRLTMPWMRGAILGRAESAVLGEARDRLLRAVLSTGLGPLQTAGGGAR
jgi:type I restriction enzyme S subunit